MGSLWCLVALTHIPLLVPAPAAAWRRPHALLAPATLAVRVRSLLPRLLAPPAPLPGPLSMREEARYSVGYGVIGNIGELRLTIEGEHAEGDRRLVRLGGQGRGSVLGLGRSEKSVVGEFDPATLASRRWSMARAGGDALTDVVEQPRPGSLSMVRQRPRAPPAPLQATFSLPALDPVGLIMRLRVAPPTADHPVQVLMLDGQALYRVTLIGAGRQALASGAAGPPVVALRVDGRADPIFYDGRDAPDRPRRTFSVWLSDDDARIPLRLTMPIGIGDVVVELVEATRTPRGR